MAWHSAGTYRITDGRGGAGAGQQRFAPLNSLAGQREPRQGAPAAVADQAEIRPENLLGRPDDPRRQRRARDRWASRPSVSPAAAPTCGSPKSSTGVLKGPGWATNATAANASLQNPLGAVQMGLIYVNPEGPNGNPDPVAAAKDIRETFFRMAMNDEETVALIAGGHTFGKTHGAGDPSLLGPEPEGARHRGSGPRLEEQTRHRLRRRHHHRRPGGHLDADADEVEQPLLRESVRIRMGAGRRARPARSSGGAKRRGSHGPGRARSVEEAACRPC